MGNSECGVFKYLPGLKVCFDLQYLLPSSFQVGQARVWGGGASPFLPKQVWILRRRRYFSPVYTHAWQD